MHVYVLHMEDWPPPLPDSPLASGHQFPISGWDSLKGPSKADIALLLILALQAISSYVTLVLPPSLSFLICRGTVTPSHVLSCKSSRRQCERRLCEEGDTAHSWQAPRWQALMTKVTMFLQSHEGIVPRSRIWDRGKGSSGCWTSRITDSDFFLPGKGLIFLARKQGAGHNDPSSSLAVLHPSWREQLPFQGKVAEAEAGCEEMLMPSGSEISLPVCLTISPKRMQVPRAGVDKKKKNFFFPEEPASKHFRLSWPYGLCCDCSTLLL